MADKNNTEKKDKSKGGFFTTKKMTRQEWQQASLKRNQQAILNDKSPFVVREAYKMARTNIIFSVSGISASDECKIIALTSASPGEGKTTSILNLSLTFAQTGSRVLLIDGDLRKPRIHQYLGVVKTNGLSTILSNQKTFDEVVFHDVKYGLDCLTAGAIPPNPAELLASDAMGSLLDNLKFRYDYIFIDTPPVTVVTDASAMSKYLTGLIVVVREGYTEHDSIDHAITLLKIADARILGFFLNDIDPANANYGSYSKSYGRRYGYKYGFRYGRKYGYSYGSNRRRGYGSKYEYKYGYGYGYGYGKSYSYADAVEGESSSEARKGAGADAGFNIVHNKVEQENATEVLLDETVKGQTAEEVTKQEDIPETTFEAAADRGDVPATVDVNDDAKPENESEDINEKE